MTHNSHLLRTPNESDLPAIVDFEIEIARISFGEDAILDPGVHRKKLTKALERDREGMFVAEDNKTGEIEGWLWVALNSNFLTGESYATFRSLATRHGVDHPRSAEVADMLFAHGIRYAEQKGVREITGKVHVNNTAMRLVYRKHGFEAEHLTMKRIERAVGKAGDGHNADSGNGEVKQD
jgi:ribosomal protein S18 acetylase RimI-like enzyme